MQDSKLKQNVLDALRVAPNLNAEGISLTVSNGFVTLSGHVPSLIARMAAERLPEQHRVADTEISRRIASLLDWSITVPKGAVSVAVVEPRTRGPRVNTALMSSSVP